MDKSELEHDREANKLFTSAISAFSIILTCSIVVAVVYVTKFWKSGTSLNPDAWGQLGDYFGGILNPIIGLGTIFLLLVNLKIQKQELALTRKELASTNDALKTQTELADRQVFEQTFFSWLNNYREIVNSVSVTSERFADKVVNPRNDLPPLNDKKEHIRPITFIQLSGLSAIKELWSFNTAEHMFSNGQDFPRAEALARQIIGTLEGQLSAEEKRKINSPNSINLYHDVALTFNAFHRKYGYQIDSLLNNLFGLISWIDQQSNMTKENKWHYVDIVFAQLSDLELNILFYYGIWHARIEYRELYEKFALLRSINKTLVIRALLEYPEIMARPFESTAFDKTEAYSKYPETKQKAPNQQ